MEELDILLSDQFAEFSQTVQRVAQDKKRLKAEFKVIYDKFQADVKALDNEALEAQHQFEAWKKERSENVGDG
jgi:uncharacterized protein (UPF0335 family)